MKPRVTVGSRQDGLLGDSVRLIETIDSVEVIRDTTEGKNLITVKVNDELIFSFDSNFEGDYIMNNHIQTPHKFAELSEEMKAKYRITPSGRLTIT